MLDFPRWKKAWLWLVTAALALAALPSIFSLAGLPWPAAVPAPLVNLRLALAGGSHILLEAESGQIAAQRLENMEETVRSTMRQAEPRIRIGEVSTSGGRLSFMVEDAGEVDRVRELLLPSINGLGTVREWDLQV